MSFTQADLTQGSVWRQLIRYAVPIITTSLLQAGYGIVDMIIVSQYLGEVGTSAVNNASQVIRIITNLAIGLCNGGSVLIGQYFGSKDSENRHRVTGTFLTLFALLGVLFSVVFFSLSHPLMALLRAPALQEAVAYMRISSVGILFIFGYNMLAVTLRSMGNSKTPLYCILVSAVLNILLDLLFVGPLQMGVGGAALATVLSQGLSFGLAFSYLWRHREFFTFERRYLKLERINVRRIFKIGVPCALQMTIAGISWLTVTGLINTYGVLYSAASGISVKIRDFSHLFLTSMSTGTSAMIAQTLGAGLYARAKKVMYTSMLLTFLLALLGVGLIEPFAPFAVSLFTPDVQVARIAVLNLRI
ncbi:MAG: MATE family efflux transporter [Christensenellales bacterium]|jgi:putative MATE family efflux protein